MGVRAALINFTLEVKKTLKTSVIEKVEQCATVALPAEIVQLQILMTTQMTKLLLYLTILQPVLVAQSKSY